MCVQVAKIANRFEISSLLEKILLKQVRWCLTFVGLYICLKKSQIIFACFDKLSGFIIGIIILRYNFSEEKSVSNKL